MTSGSSADPVAVAAGDICDSGGGCKQTAAVIGQIKPTRVLTLGDNAYPDGTLSNFTTYFEPYWGQYKPVTSPAPGNHDYHVAGGADYFTYFNNPPQYYSFDLGSWHLVSLDGEIGIASGSTQETWFRNDLAAHSNKCTLVYWHEPRFSSGSVHGNNSSFQALWQDAYNGRVEIVLSGHNHQYERFAPMNASGALDTAEGVREFVVGTGGAPLYSFGTIQPNRRCAASATATSSRSPASSRPAATCPAPASSSRNSQTESCGSCPPRSFASRSRRSAAVSSPTTRKRSAEAVRERELPLAAAG